MIGVGQSVARESFTKSLSVPTAVAVRAILPLLSPTVPVAVQAPGCSAAIVTHVVQCRVQRADLRLFPLTVSVTGCGRPAEARQALSP